MNVTPHALKASIIDWCATIGRDSLLVQGAGGNVSWKDDDTLWVKASGMRIADADKRDIFVPVDLNVLRDAINKSDFASVPQARETAVIKPSIETWLHALMPHKIVVHLHAVEALSWLVRENYVEAITARLPSNLRWVGVGYQKPGSALASAVQAALISRPEADIIFLQNHGVVIGADNLEPLVSQLLDVTEALHTSPVIQISSPSKASPTLSPYITIQNSLIQGLAHHPALFGRLASSWALYPDHIVFLGPKAHAYDSWNAFYQKKGADGLFPELVFIRNEGVFALPSFGGAKLEQLACYAEVLSRQSVDARLTTLTEQQVSDLLDWDAEKYRQKLADFYE